ncbi:MAG: response regulator [Spirochaetales bacterium]|nr:response regulator [Spirochaetales bacterium]
MDKDRPKRQGYDFFLPDSRDGGKRGRTLFKLTTLTFSLLYLIFLLPDRIPLPYYGAVLLWALVYGLILFIFYRESGERRNFLLPVILINLLPFLTLILVHLSGIGNGASYFNEIAFSLVIITTVPFLNNRKILSGAFYMILTGWVLFLVLQDYSDDYFRYIFLILAMLFSFFLSQYSLKIREEELREKQKKYAALELIGKEGKIGLFLFDPVRDAFLSDGSFYRILGRNDTLRNRGFTELMEALVPEEDRILIWRAVQDLRRGDISSLPFDVRVRSEGKEHWLRVDGTIVEEEPGYPQLIGTLTDISSLKQSESRARDDADSIKALLMTGDIYLWKLALPAREFQFPSSYYSREETGKTRLLYETYREKVHPDYREILDEAYGEMAREERDRLEVDYLYSSEERDRYFWLRDVGFVSARDEEGRPAEISGYTIDIDNDRRDAARIDQALRASGFVPWHWDRKERYTEFDEVYFDLLPGGEGKSRITQQEFFKEMIHPGDSKKVEDFFWEIYSRDKDRSRIGRTLVFRLRFAPGGEYFWAEGRLTGIRYDREDQPLIIDGIVRDITAEKTRDMNLEEERKEREVADTKNRFFSTISHELLTPLNAFSGLSERLGQTPLGREQEEILGKMRNSYDLLIARIHELLDISDLGQGDISLRRETFSPRDIMAEVAESLADTALAHEVELTVQAEEDLPPLVLGDRERVGQIIGNLVKNGIKFTPRGMVALTGAVGERNGETCLLRFAVRDEGIGIPREKIASIFEPFGQVDNSLSRSREGIGLSLAINKQLVELMGGTIEVISTLGEGSTFLVKIPFFLPQERGDEQKTACLYPDSRVLVIDDNPLNREIAADILKVKGIKALTAEGGTRGLELVKSERPHLVFMDIQMPEMDGYRATRLLREQEAPDSHIPVVALTANITEKDREEAYASGMDGFLAKPVDIHRIEEVLARWLSEFCVHREEEVPSPPVGPAPIPGIAMEETLERFGGEYGMLLSLLKDYGEDYEFFPDRVKELWKKGDHREIYGRIHALKGVSGSLGIEEVYSQTQEMSALYREKGLFRLEELEKLEELMNRFHGELNRFTEEN